jgi:hypothetical protein
LNALCRLSPRARGLRAIYTLRLLRVRALLRGGALSKSLTKSTEASFPRTSSPEYLASTSKLVRLIDSTGPLRSIGASVNSLLTKLLGVKVVRSSASGIPLDDSWFRQLSYFDRLFERIQDVEGDIVECGVAWGRTLAMLASLERARGASRHLWGFDSWGGLPEPEQDDLPASRFGPFEWADVESVRNTLRNHGFRDEEIASSITLTPGLFAETLGTYAGTQIALLHLDVVLRRSYAECLEALWPRVQVGGVVPVDDYAVPALHPGANKAIDEFVEIHGSEARLERDALADRYFVVKVA